MVDESRFTRLPSDIYGMDGGQLRKLFGRWRRSGEIEGGPRKKVRRENKERKRRWG